MDNALYQFQQSVGRANDEKLNKENDAKDKLQSLHYKFAVRVKSPLDALGGSLTEDGAHDLLKKAGKYGLKKLGATSKTAGEFEKAVDYGFTGAAIGATIGSFIPVVGTGIGGGIGFVAGEIGYGLSKLF